MTRGDEAFDDKLALGATMYLLLSGKPVRERGSVTEQLLGAMTQPVPSLGRVVELPRSVVAVVDRALAFDRDGRFPDARSMQLAVRAALDELRFPDSRAAVPPSLAPAALSLTPHPPNRARGSSPLQVMALPSPSAAPPVGSSSVAPAPATPTPARRAKPSQSY